MIKRQRKQMVTANDEYGGRASPFLYALVIACSGYRSHSNCTTKNEHKLNLIVRDSQCTIRRMSRDHFRRWSRDIFSDNFTLVDPADLKIRNVTQHIMCFILNKKSPSLTCVIWAYFSKELSLDFFI